MPLQTGAAYVSVGLMICLYSVRLLSGDSGEFWFRSECRFRPAAKAVPRMCVTWRWNVRVLSTTTPRYLIWGVGRIGVLLILKGMLMVLFLFFRVITTASHLAAFIPIFHLSYQGRSLVRWSWILCLATFALNELVYTRTSSANMARFDPGNDGMSDVNRLYRSGANTDPCGTPTCTLLFSDKDPSTLTWKVRPTR